MSPSVALAPKALAAIRDVRRHLDRGDSLAAERALPIVLLLAPGQAITFRLAAQVYQSRGRSVEAIAFLREAIALAPGDPDLLAAIAATQLQAGEFDGAIHSLRELVEVRPTAATWLELGIAFDQAARAKEALEAADKALALDPTLSRARLLRARSLQTSGDIALAASEYRLLIAARQHVATAWFALLDIKTITLDAAEIEAFIRFAESTPANAHDRILLDFALGRVHENAGDFAQAMAVMTRANEAVRMQTRWDSLGHRAYVDRILVAFARTHVEHGSSSSTRGSEAIFLVGLPRSGSTLFEQMLAAHPQVEGASELADLPAVIEAESTRRGKPFPDWASEATPTDWERMGNAYLARTAMWRQRRPRFTDKAPENWQYAGAIAAMLPGARIIDCRRDAVETCWSCYKQLFAAGRVAFTYSLDDLSDYWRDYLRASAQWEALHPSQYRTFRYADLVADPELTARSLLEFCGLEFQESCLQPHLVRRDIRTTSSAQVREPISGGTARADRYGELLAPLRARLSGLLPAHTKK